MVLTDGAPEKAFAPVTGRCPVVFSCCAVAADSAVLPQLRPQTRTCLHLHVRLCNKKHLNKQWGSNVKDTFMGKLLLYHFTIHKKQLFRKVLVENRENLMKR